jgi:hypothetical protein
MPTNGFFGFSFITGKVRVTLTWRRVLATIVAIEK